MLAGVAAAETSISWSGTATAGIARDGSTTKAYTKAASALATADQAVAATKAQYATLALYQAYVEDVLILDIAAATGGALTATTEATIRQEIATDEAVMTQAESILGGTAKSNLVTANNLIRAVQAKVLTTLDNIYGTASTAAGKAGDFESYSEVNTTVKGSVTTENGMTISAAMSLDAGNGYDFADDDGFDGRTGSTGAVTLDNVTIATAMGTFKIDQDAVTHLVDGDDDGNADILYTNTFGSMSISSAIDVTKDTDAAFVAGTAATLVSTTGGNATAAAGEVVYTAATTSTVQDVAWSAKISMPVAGGTAFIALDEEGGNIFGASTTLSGIGISFDSKLEALDSELKKDRSNTVGLSYAMGATSLGATWNSVEDGNQWGISAGYAADGMSVSASTNEGSAWAVSGSMALGGGTSAVAGVNYTEDAYLGLSFAF